MAFSTYSRFHHLTLTQCFPITVQAWWAKEMSFHFGSYFIKLIMFKDTLIWVSESLSGASLYVPLLFGVT